MTVLIDGHNLIGAIPDLRLDDPNDEAKLLTRLRAYRARVGKRLVVYFDPGLSYQSPARQSQGGITIRQAGSGQQADKLIIRDIRRHHNPRELTVVTSDRDIQHVARQHRAQVIDSGTFAAGINRQPQPDGTGNLTPFSEEELREWLAVFGQSNG
jgi:predicted RNA-binding protein with PIN domain